MEKIEKSEYPNPIWLNVGGESFCCSFETLTWHEGNGFLTLKKNHDI